MREIARSVLAALLVLGLLGQFAAAHAAVKIFAYEEGNGVLLRAEGELRFGGDDLPGRFFSRASVNPNAGSLVVGGWTTGADLRTAGLPFKRDRRLPFRRPESFGEGGVTFATQTSGTRIAVTRSLFGVDPDYRAGEPLTAETRFVGATLESLGLEIGTHVWRPPNEEISLIVSPVPVPLPAVGPVLLGGFLGWAAWRCRRGGQCAPA